MRSKNFSFVKRINNSMYVSLCEIEHDAYINPLNASHKCRILFEIILSDLLEEKGISSPSDIVKKLELVRQHKLRLPNENRLPVKNVQCYLHDQTVCVEPLRAYMFLKNLGNASSHKDPYPWEKNSKNPIPNRENVFHALALFHTIIQRVYESQIKDEVNKFEAKNIPIGEYFIENEKIGITDSARTNCIKEYIAYKYASDNINNKIYALIREYQVSDIADFDSLTFDRLLDVYGVLGNQMRRNGITLRKLNEPQTEYANYFVVYEYDVNMIPLRTLLRKEDLGVDEKMKLCLDIAKQLSTFHEAEDHVYLRLLTYDSIMVRQLAGSKSEKVFEPIIVKFDFAKIEYKDGNSGGTILKLLQSFDDNPNLGVGERASRYCVNDRFSKSTDWEKVDVGSLGVLFTDICKGDITTKKPTHLIEEMSDDGIIPTAFLELITSMINPVNLSRPRLKKVIDDLTEIADDPNRA